MDQAKDYPRQTSSEIECVSDILDVSLEGENSQYLSDCKTTATNLASLSFSSSQSFVDSVGRLLCTPACGKAILDAISACGIFDDFEPGSEALYTRLYVGICGTNQRRQKCYEIFSNVESYRSPFAECYDTYISSGECGTGCQSVLTDAVEYQQCCINVYYEFYSINVDPKELHDSCNVDLPDPCDNSLLTVPEVTLEVNLESYSNPDHEECGGDHCDGILGGECDNIFTFCLRIVGSSSCLDTITTNDITNDEFTFGASELETLGINNPLKFSVFTSSNLELIVTVTDEDIFENDEVDEFVIPLDDQQNNDSPTAYTGVCRRDTRIVLRTVTQIEDGIVEGTTETTSTTDEDVTPDQLKKNGSAPSYYAGFLAIASAIAVAAIFVIF